jgi:hypothetical protein
VGVRTWQKFAFVPWSRNHRSMSDMNKRAGSNDCDDCDDRGERGEKGKHGKRGPRGHEGRDGEPGSTGPTGPTGPTGDAGFVPVIAAGVVAAGGAFSGPQKGFTGVIAHVPGSGIYDLGAVSVPSGFAVEVSLVNGPGMISWATSGSNIIVQTFDATGTPTDRTFSIVVYDLN